MLLSPRASRCLLHPSCLQLIKEKGHRHKALPTQNSSLLSPLALFVPRGTKIISGASAPHSAMALQQLGAGFGAFIINPNTWCQQFSVFNCLELLILV